MNDEDRRRAFAEAFITQARSDWSVYRLLTAQPRMERCHTLHYLQMACEKLAKAYRLRDTTSAIGDLTSKHIGFEKFVVPYIATTFKNDYRDKRAQLKSIIKDARKLAREIEEVAPAVDRDSRPANAEYPWEQGDQVVAPCLYSFPSLDLLRESSGRSFLKIVERALTDFRI